MAGTIIVDRIESDASYASTINVAGQITFSNTVNFGAFAGTAPVAGFYLPTTNNLAFTTASTERMRIDSSGNVGIGTSSPSTFTGYTTVSVNNATNGGIYNILVNGTETARLQAFSGIFNIAAKGASTALTFETNGSERMRIDSSGNVGIGFTTPGTKLEISDATAEVVTTQLRAAGGTAANRIARLSLVSSGNYTWAVDGGNDSMRFTQDGTERMRLNNNNGFILTNVRLLISGASGIPAPVNNGDGNVGTTAAGGLNIIGKGSSTDILFLNKNGSTAGSVATGAATITTSSDERLKENLQPITGALDIVCQMRHETGNYKSDPSRTVAFLIAQDVDKLFPYAVEKADPDSWGVNYNWITPLHGAAITELTALVKEQQAIIQTLTDRITALEGTTP